MFHRGTSYLSVDREDNSAASPSSGSLLRGIGCLILFSCILFLVTPSPTSNYHNGNGVKVPHHLPVDPRERTRKLPVRLQKLSAQSQLVGDHLQEVKDGKKTVEEAIHNKKDSGIDGSAQIGGGAFKSAPMTLTEISTFLNSFLKKLNSSNIKNKHASFHGILAAYHDLVVKHLYPWDQEYLHRMPPRRQDGSIYLSVVSFRDEFCVDTLKDAYQKAKNPDNLFTGLVQQNCEEEKCRRGNNVGPDPDCYNLFCSSAVGKKYCNNGQIRLLRMKSSESLGPVMARYFASKLFMGEEWYMQIDSHTNFLQNWDALSIHMLEKAPSDKPVISHLPPPNTSNLQEKTEIAAPRICGASFATSDIESQIVRLERSYNYDRVKIDTPRFAPFVAAGFLIAHSGMLRDVPFDPFLPYLFLGEEILLSARLWTSGYDIFSPTISIVGHRYERHQHPKFWEAIHMTFTNGVHNPLQMLVLNRIKQQLGYPESSRDMVKPKSLFTAVDQYSMGHSRTLDEYLKLVGLNVSLKEATYTAWCETGQPPPGFEKHNHLYNS